MKTRAVVDPVCQHSAEDDEELIRPGQKSTDGSRDVLRGVERSHHRTNSHSEPGDEPADIKNCQVTPRIELKENSDQNNDTCNEERKPSSDSIRHETCDDCTREAASLECGDDIGL